MKKKALQNMIKKDSFGSKYVKVTTSAGETKLAEGHF
jgi:hypothetical protein